MTLWRMLIREIIHRKLGFAVGVISVAVAAAGITGAIAILDIHDVNSQVLVEQKERETKKHMVKLKDDMRKAMLKLGLNLVIIPKDQNVGDWYSEDTGSSYMKEQYADDLASSGIISVRHMLPMLQHKITWPEKKRKIILIGVKGEVPNLSKSPKEPLVQPVGEGEVVLGHELHHSMGLKVGDQIKIMGQNFQVARCHIERGNKDDISAWIPLDKAQDMLDKKGMINAILALQCLCVGRDLSKVRSDITSVLPNTQVLELGTERALARYEARMSVAREAKASLVREVEFRSNLRIQRERFAGILVGVIILGACIWITFLFFQNVHHRRCEIGILRSLGFGGMRIMSLFLGKAILMGIAGGILGGFLGFFAGRALGLVVDKPHEVNLSMFELFKPWVFVTTIISAPLISAIGGWIPAIIAIQQDPARILRKE
jgi:putative ABC transport system permease protein